MTEERPGDDDREEAGSAGPGEEGPGPGGSPHLEEDEEHDDTVIAVAAKRSALALLAIAVVGALVWWVARRPAEEAPEETIAVSAPEAVPDPAEAGAPRIPFSDVASGAGISFVHTNGAYGEKLLPETMGGGVVAFDYDGDADADLLFVDSGPWPHHEPGRAAVRVALYRNDTPAGGALRFADVTAVAGLTALTGDPLYGMGAAVADYDADGDRDLFLTGVGRNRLLRNDGGRFVDVTGTAGVGGDASEWSSSAGFFDADGDGDLDLFVCNYVRWTRDIDLELDFRLTGVGRAFGPPQSYEGSFPYLYRNEGDGTFTDISEGSGIRVTSGATGVPMAKSLAVAFVDLDADGRMEVLVANDTVRNFLFHNQGPDAPALFEEVGEFYGIAYDRNGNATGAMGVDAAHHRNDRNLGFAVGNFANEMSSIYVAQDDPAFFVDESIAEGIGAPSRLVLTFGLFFFDADLDGRLDLLQANGHIEEEIGKVDASQSYLQAGQLFWNGGDAGFELLEPEAVGDLAGDRVGRGAAYADFDSDGDLDVVLTQVGGAPVLLRNDQALGHHWLRVRLAGAAPNTDAIGAWVELAAGGRTQRRQVMPTRSYLSQVEPVVTFGLESTDAVESLVVEWPDGSRQEAEVPGVDRTVVVEQGS